MDPIVKDALDFIRQKLDEYDDKIAATSSFGKDSICLLHLVLQIKPDIPVLWVRTPFKPKETLELADQVTKDWKLNLKIVESDKVHDRNFLEEVVIKPNLPKTNPELCCQIFKVEPLMRTVNEMNLDAWFSGLRRTESEKRDRKSVV